MTPSYTITNESITIVWKGKAYTVKRGAPNFTGLMGAIMDQAWDAVPNFLTVTKAVGAWAHGKFSLDGEEVVYQEDRLPKELQARMMAMITNGENPVSFMRFWERLSKNPEERSREQLFKFLEHTGIPIDEDGYLLAYKGVTDDFKDVFTKTIDNSPGKTNEMPRSKISSDPSSACSYGYHAGALAYADKFGAKNVIVQIDPADVVCIPYDSSRQKMRLCKYKVIGLYGSVLPATSVTKEYLGVDVEDKGGVTEGPYLGDAAATKTKAPKKAKAETAEGRKSRSRGVSDPSMWEGFADMDTAKLMSQSLDNLRRFAAKSLKIVGASKIKGGKYGLVQSIMRAKK